MKHIVIGTAGHIDHGKTTLIKALTGKDTDRLKEEKQRGISIDLGFTFFDLPSGNRAGIVDVPGHERFIKNMLAGVQGIDIVLMVIAADEGVMPQTIEHLQILRILGIKKGLIVVTKCRKVDREWLEEIKLDIREKFKNTFLEDVGIHEVDSITGAGLKELVISLDKASAEVAEKNISGHFRMPVDRVFSISGIGTVVTGTILNGSINEGDTIEVYTKGATSKARSIQVYDQSVKVAESGERCALNLSGIKTSEVKRGDIIAEIHSLNPSFIIDCKFNYLKSNEKPLKNNQRVKIYHGTSEIIGRVSILDKEEIIPGEEAYVQIRLEEKIACKREDKFVIRNYSPMVTLGGGTIIEPLAKKAKRYNESYINELIIKEKGENKDILEKLIESLSDDFPTENELLKYLSISKDEFSSQIKFSLEDKKIFNILLDNGEVYVHNNFLQDRLNKMVHELELFHGRNPLRPGMDKEELKSKIFKQGVKSKIYDYILCYGIEQDLIRKNDNHISLKEFNIKYTEAQNKIRNHIIIEYKKDLFNPPKYSDLIKFEKSIQDFEKIYNLLIESRYLIKLPEEVVLSIEAVNQAKDKLISYIEKSGNINVGILRDELKTNRKVAVALLEYFDEIKLTKRVENTRILF
ncbi:selenocysteine-specific elongation factor [Clostridium pascui]|uniref:selenocysteine-specific translation elongation factor n=1 Tax=Clostridium pascui TaxID=46609 RepID=UPI00195A4E11|nr:selenocysteine-specific translation elongation factor [Clostridium pascui]MBM7870199.1 selenocysteine-specific elongation factor [Clostridium pascui]